MTQLVNENNPFNPKFAALSSLRIELSGIGEAPINFSHKCENLDWLVLGCGRTLGPARVFM